MASRDDIDRVKSAVSILDVVTPYVALKRAGSVWKGLCPFHSEKTPSFQVNPDRGMWHCFGQCATGGDIFKFLERIDNLSFGEALERLAARAGVTLTDSRTGPSQGGRRETLFRALEAAAQYYQETLLRSPHALLYLDGRRVSAETQRSFRLGYAGESFDGLTAYLRRNRIDLDAAIEAGILAKSDRDDAAPYDKMKGRIVCPILDVHDRPIAFGGRLMADEPGRPKYLNTAETGLFSKGKTFYALSRARKAMSDGGCAIIVEGYFDVLAMHQAGFENTVATLGTSLTAEHADILKRHVRRTVLAFDADAAGLKAAARANAILEAKEMEVLVLDMPKGEDPDSLIREGRAGELQDSIDHAMPVREFQLRTVIGLYLSRHDLSERDRSIVFRREVTPLLRATQSVIERERYIRMCAPLHPIFANGSASAEDEIRREIAGSAAPAGTYGRARSSSPGRAQSGLQTSAPRSGVEASEENLLRAMLGSDPRLADLVREMGVTDDLFITTAHRELARRVLSSQSAQPVSDATIYAEDEDSAVAEIATRLLVGGDAQEPITAEIVADSVDRLHREQTVLVELKLKSKADLGDEAALRDLMILQRRMHGSRPNPVGQHGA